jgi:hypothetical protein
MNMIRCVLLPGLRTHTTHGGPLVIGQELMSFAVSDIVESYDASGAPLRAN